jgi:hypothetical protein
MYGRAWWGPLELVRDADRVETQVPGSARVVLACPDSNEGHPHNVNLFATLREGLPVLLDGEPRIVLRQPRRPWWFRRDRAILVEGDPTIVPPGLLLRARWLQGIGLETSTSHGAATNRRLIRPPFDLFLGLAVSRPRVDRSVSPDIIAVWAAAQDRLVDAVHG